ncbi:MAG: hypothetical protein IPI53_10255 [Saprospiraceae bacterium]|nr:hypothetical protein [Saprospiraceae bacterium]
MDFANMKTIHDTLISEGRIDGSTKHFAYGYSTRRGICRIGGPTSWVEPPSICTHPAVNALSLEAIVPYVISISENDRHPDVGAAANAQSKINIKIIPTETFCTTLMNIKKSPLYPKESLIAL